MPDLPFHQEQLDFVISLANHRIEFLNPFFRFLNYFDSPYFLFILIPILWIGISYRWGLRIFYWFTLNNLIVTSAKMAIGWPRPSTEMPELGMFHFPSFGFPSGGAQGAMFLGCLLIYYWRTPAAWIIGTIYILLISFSRLYLGVHYPIDILGGWIFAWILFALFIYFEEPLEHFLIKRGLNFCLFCSLAIPAVLLYLLPNKHYIIGALMGIGLGSYISLKSQLFLPDSVNFREGAIRSLIGIALLSVFIVFIPDHQTFTVAFFISFFMSTAASPICKWVMKKLPKSFTKR